ncbi:MAG: DUF1232 domain-containing protein [Chloroflexi bacterium]|nr:DUF1232 domain-containing protein [Chloroflexota bacterium]
MSEERKPVVAPANVGALAQFVRTLRLVWRLFNDARVPGFPKLIIPAAILYVISPIDLVPDLALGLGQLDDLGVVALAIALFIETCPRALVEEHRRALATDDAPPTSDENVIEGSARRIPDDETRG